MKEIWKPIPSLNGLYEASNFGRIKSLNGSYHKKDNQLMSLIDNSSGYLYFTVSINNQRKNIYVHRAVCEAFHLNQREYKYVNHKDGIKSNNHATNLEWCDGSKNMKHAYSIGLIKAGGGKTNSIKVIDNKTGMIFDCIREAADYFGIKYNLMKEALNRSTPNKRNEIYSRLSKIQKPNRS